jgi:hypothetical protein
MDGGSEACHLSLRFRLIGDLDRDALERALNRLLERHEALRTRFQLIENDLLPIIDSAKISFELSYHDLRSSDDIDAQLFATMIAEARAPFDLQRGPLIRGRLIATGANQHVLIITGHHINLDGWSISILLRELEVLYDVFSRGLEDPLSLPPLQYADYATWQRKSRTKELLKTHTEYWRQTLEGLPDLLTIPTDRKRPPTRDFAGDVVSLEFTQELIGRMKAVCSRYGLTLYMIVLAAWSLVLSRLSGQDDVLIGTPFANRTNRLTESVVGFFSSLLALRITLSGNPTIEEHLLRTRTVALGALKYHALPLEQIVDLVKPSRSNSHPPLFHTLFAWQNFKRERMKLVSLAVDDIIVGVPRPPALFDLVLEIRAAGDCINGGLIFPTALFDAVTARGYIERLFLALYQITNDVSQPAKSVMCC